MKSIVEEASSIAKAIQNGWIRAGKPQEFTVRIFEEPEKNFFGFIKKPAKIGIFYKETPVQQHNKGRDSRKQQPYRQTQTATKGALEREQYPRPQQSQKSGYNAKPNTINLQTTQQKAPEQPKQPKWTPELIDGCTEWLHTIIKTAGIENAPFTFEQKQYFLTIRFAKPVLQDKRKEQLLFKNWSHLLVQALRHRFKRGLHGFKIIITSAA